ncbi:MAG TPA: PfkB family carbohydrate kinase [Candidatus Limnocylindrales bacterium]
MDAATRRPAIPRGLLAAGVVAIGRHLHARAAPAIADALANGGVRAFERGDGSLAVERETPDLPIARSGVPLPVLVDPVGAGHAFCAGFIAARLDGTGLAEALAIGNTCGASAAAALGDQTGLPDRALLAAILLSATEAGGPDTIR